MPSLADVAPPELVSEVVDLHGTLVLFRGLSGDEWMRIYTRFPAIAAALAGRESNGPALVIDELRYRACVIAAGAGAIGDHTAEHDAILRLTEAEQRTIVEMVFKLSHPGHVFGPLLNGAVPPSAAPDTEAQVTK